MPASNTKVWIVGATLCLVAGLAYARAADVDKDDTVVHLREMVAAAQKAYDGAFDFLSHGRGSSFEECYTWSRRVMDAESRVNRGAHAAADAADAHEKRMQMLDRVARQLAKAAEGSGRSVWSTEYYVLEAKALVAEASRGK